MKVWDISRTLSNDLAEWPGDEPCRFRLTNEKTKGASVNLGAISMISSYYTQENSSLLFNNLSEVIHQRCDGLKINIQLKILHATVELPQGVIPQGE
jgi:hypothetical protein